MIVSFLNLKSKPAEFPILPLDDAIASGAVFVIVSASDGRTEVPLEPAQ